MIDEARAETEPDLDSLEERPHRLDETAQELAKAKPDLNSQDGKLDRVDETTQETLMRTMRIEKAMNTFPESGPDPIEAITNSLTQLLERLNAMDDRLRAMEARQQEMLDLLRPPGEPGETEPEPEPTRATSTLS